MAPVHCAAGSDGETNFGVTSLAAPNAASLRVARNSFTARLAVCGSRSLFPLLPVIERCWPSLLSRRVLGAKRKARGHQESDAVAESVSLMASTRSHFSSPNQHSSSPAAELGYFLRARAGDTCERLPSGTSRLAKIDSFWKLM